MKVFFDARYTRTDYHDGISRYSAELGNALAKTMLVTFLICDEGQKKWFPPNTSFIKIHPPTSIKEPFTALILNKYQPDIVYSPMQTIGTLGRAYTSVLTVHDMIYYRHKQPPSFLPWYVRFGWRLYHLSYLPQRLVLKGADVLTTVSQTSLNDLTKANMTNLQVHIVSNAPQKFSTYQVTHQPAVSNIVYMGSFMQYKNVETLIRGMEWLPGRTLHLLSRIRPERQAELEKIIPKNVHVVFHNGVTDDEYERILADNAVLVTASRDEGYGIPVAEAMNMGVPVVLSDIPVFREVGADAALYFSPDNPKVFAEQVQRLDDPTLREQLVAKGLKHMESFSWDASAKVLLNAINQRYSM